MIVHLNFITEMHKYFKFQVMNDPYATWQAGITVHLKYVGYKKLDIKLRGARQGNHYEKL